MMRENVRSIQFNFFNQIEVLKFFHFPNRNLTSGHKKSVITET